MVFSKDEATKSLVRVAQRGDVSSDYWAAPTTSAGELTGISMKQWIEEIERTGLILDHYDGKGVNAQTSVFPATGVMRHPDEAATESPHRATRGFPPSSTFEYEKSAPELVLDRLSNLETELLAYGDRSTGSALPSEIIGACHNAALPLDDNDIMASFRLCRPDKVGRLSIDSVLKSLKATQQSLIAKMQSSPKPKRSQRGAPVHCPFSSPKFPLLHHLTVCRASLWRAACSTNARILCFGLLG